MGLTQGRFAALIAAPDRLLWAVRVRWLTIGGFLLLSIVASRLEVFSSIAACWQAAGLGCLLNAVNGWCVRRQRHVFAVSAVAIPMDHLFTTYLVVSTGGPHSPFVVLYVVQVLTTAMLVDTLVAAVSALMAVSLWITAMQLHDAGAIGLVPLAVSTSSAAYQAVWAGFWSYCLALLVYLGGYISGRLRLSERDLAERNQRLEETIGSLRATHAELRQAYDRLRQTEAQLVQSEKLRSLGELVAGVAHELNNPISFISANMEHLRSYTERLQRYAEACEMLLCGADGNRSVAPLRRQWRIEETIADLPAVLTDCEEGARRSKQIVEELRTFSRAEQRTDWSRVDLHRGIESTLALLGHRLRGRIELHRDFGDLPEVDGLPGPLNQVFMNLVVNAIDAIGEQSGHIWISTRSFVADGERIEISIRDDGCGIPADVQLRVFDPFFTTKEVGRGTGLGLSVSYGIAARHGGSLSVESTPGSGATFKLTLPVSQANAVAAA
jgi:signal transduction histidine kinase